ncbi:MAG: PLP-dependent aminotransferase family protein [Thermoanaerobaculia bacterium]
MAKTAAGVILSSATLDRSSELPLFRQLFVELRQAILEGHLPAEARLPSSRTLATELVVSRNTVIQAFDLLVDEGFVESRVGDGSYVSAEVGSRGVDSGGASVRTPSRKRPLSARGERQTRTVIPPRASSGGPLALGVPALDQFPLALWRRLAGRRLGRADTELMGYGDPAGLDRLRVAIARHLTTARGVQCAPVQVLIFASAQEALTIAARVLTDPGDSAWLEEPAYMGVRNAVVAAGATPVPVPVDGEGLRVRDGREKVNDAKVVYLTPSHQFPLGMTMSLRRRLELIDWAAESGAWIVEDDYDSEFRLEGRPICALQGLLPEQVIYVGTFSKALFPALRLAYAIVPEELRTVFLAARCLGNPHPPTVTQAIVADFIETGHFATHLRRMTSLYAERKTAVVSELEAVDSALRLLPSNTGLHVAATLKGGEDRALSRQAAAEGIALPALSRYYLGKRPRQGVLIGYGSAPPPELRPAIRRIVELSQASSSA